MSQSDAIEPGQPHGFPKPEEVRAPIVDARTLFGGQREIWIEYDGVRYRLRITRRNKLILQK